MPLAGYGMKSMWPIFKTKMSINQSQANINDKMLFGKITHLEDSTVRKISVRGLYGNRE